MALIPIHKTGPGKIQKLEHNEALFCYTPTAWVRCSQHRQLSGKDFVALMQSGADLSCCQPSESETYFNLIVDKWHEAHQKHLLGTNGAADNLQVDYVAVGTGYSTPTASDTIITTEIHRGAPDSAYANTVKTTIFILTVDETNGNPAFSGSTKATIQGTTNTTTTIYVASGEGASFTANDRIQVTLAATGNENSVVESIATDTLTLKAANALTQAPVAGDTVIIKWGCIGTFAGAATASADTGTLLSHANVDESKDSSKFFTIEIQMITASV